MSNNPLVSFVVLAYRHEQFIREAMRSAFAQTYEPLEIIVSDDCSPDRTFDIIREENQGYRGPHKIIVNRNSRNEGLAVNFNRACEMATGDLIVAQGGDDVSYPHRTKILRETWLSPTQVDLVFSNVEVVDAAGKRVRDRWFQEPYDPSSVAAQDVLSRYGIGVLGCSSAFSRSLITRYGGLSPSVSAEDVVISFRALLERGIRYVDDILVKYRTHDGNLVLGRNDWRTSDRNRAKRDSIGRLAIVKDCLQSYQVGRHCNPTLLRALRDLERHHAYDVACYDTSRLGAIPIVLRALGQGIGPKKTAALIARHVLRIGRNDSRRK